MLLQSFAFVLLGWMMTTSTPDSPATQPADLFAHRSVILFQGDSITDGNRGRNADPNHILGHGYAFLIAAKMGSELADRELIFINRGVSGNTVADLAGRWDTDAIALKPDVISILIGINDVMNHVPADEFEKDYDALLARTREALPQVKLVLVEPFFLPVGDKIGDHDAFAREMTLRRAVVERLAQKYAATLIHAQAALDHACDRAPPTYWIWDGIHPTYAGHQVLADSWLAGGGQD